MMNSIEWPSAGARTARLAVHITLLFLVTVMILVLVSLVPLSRRFPLNLYWGTGRVLNGPVSSKIVAAMQISLTLRNVPKGNPWRGASFRSRRDLLSSASGCGGSVVPALKPGSVAALRYVVRDHNDRVIDVTTSDVHVVIGRGQTPRIVDDALVGVCAGELVFVKMPRVTGKGHWRSARSVTLYISKVLSEADVAGAYVSKSNIGRVDNTELFSTRMTDAVAESVEAVRSRRGSCCNRACKSKGLMCAVELFATVNNCPKLRQAFACVSCEIATAGTAGADMPAWVSKSAPVGHARGACLVAPRSIKPSCDARYIHTRRLCPCIGENKLRRWRRASATLWYS